MAKTKLQKKFNVKNLILNIFVILSILFLIWFIWSFINVNAHNLTDPQNISEYNLFYIMIKYWKAY